MDKREMVRALCALLEQEIVRATETAERTRAGATHEEARPENDKDTRALEQTYLARGQAQRVVDLQQALKLATFMDVRAFGPDDPIGISALVQLESDEGERWVLFAPAGGGHKLAADGGGPNVDVVTPESPLGKALAGRYQGDEFTLRTGNRVREFVIVAVH
jgi:transcription elongation GreA/GreB family factor